MKSTEVLEMGPDEKLLRDFARKYKLEAFVEEVHLSDWVIGPRGDIWPADGKLYVCIDRDEAAKERIKSLRKVGFQEDAEDGDPDLFCASFDPNDIHQAAAAIRAIGLRAPRAPRRVTEEHRAKARAALKKANAALERKRALARESEGVTS